MSIIWCQQVNNANQVLPLAHSAMAHIEMPISDVLQFNSDDMALLESFVADAKLTAPSFTGLLPAEVTITETGFNSYVWDLHTKKALKKVAALGGNTVCIDNGPSKYLHWEHEQLKSRQQLFRYITSTCQAASELGIDILMEPLSEGYTNHLNSLDDVKGFIELIDLPNLGISVSSQLLLQDSQLTNIPKLKRIRVEAKHLVEQDHITQLQQLIETLNKHHKDLIVSLSASTEEAQCEALMKPFKV
ncbi:MAG TPA: hypothetical protein DC023_03830 [Oceanospirillaceae bacterium]|nr:hypothetical protein [Oceanospirillaceae bacterium]